MLAGNWALQDKDSASGRRMKGEDAHSIATGREGAVCGPRDLRDFAGRWRLSRRIEDRLTGVEGRMEGEARLRAVAGGLEYDEAGLLRYGAGPALQATRRYLWRAGEAGRIAVLFEDGRAFHDFALAESATAAHFCAPDDYAVSYAFAGWPRWRAVWRVRGPRKDYLSTTDYTPG